MKDKILAGLRTERDKLVKEQTELNREMMRLPMDTRRKRWSEYYARLGELTTRRQQIEKTTAAFLNESR